MNQTDHKLTESFASADALIMLTWSDWFTELRSNRYHYATRFAKHLPVLFVQPDLSEPCYRLEATGVGNLQVLHVFAEYGEIQTKLLNQAMLSLGYIQPIFWVYNSNFCKLLKSRHSVLNVYHATEDYLASESKVKFTDPTWVSGYIETISSCQLVIAVSDGVREGIEANINYQGKICSIYNGCDYEFYSPIINQSFASQIKPDEKVALYQGNIFDKLDYYLLMQLAEKMPDWTFKFCGKVVEDDACWRRLKSLHNVHYLGLLTVEQLREEAYQSTVGIIPFVKQEWIIKRSYPLKTFEYLAAGLPVVSTPIESIDGFSDVILFAETPEAFMKKMVLAGQLRFDEAHTKRRLELAARQSYDLRFTEIVKAISEQINAQAPLQHKLNVAILFESSSVFVNTIHEHLASFNLYSKHNVTYIPATQCVKAQFDLNRFDVVVLHYSIRLCVDRGNHTLSPAYAAAIKSYGGYKVLFIQDEYDTPEIARKWMEQLGIHLVYTCVPECYREQVYPSQRFPKVEFINTLTGYIPISANTLLKKSKTSSRLILIGYRGRALPFWYGSLGQEKLNIGIQMKAYCLARGLNVDIEWETEKRIYGADWYAFLANCRATLGTESGSNLFDDEGGIRLEIEKRQTQKSALKYEDVHDELIAPNELIRMNQISPKFFESILFKTALILFEGGYSGVLIPNVHYIPLKKDFSNIDEVLSLLQNDALIDEMTERAYRDIIESGRYHYKKFVEDFDVALEARVYRKTSNFDTSRVFHPLNEGNIMTMTSMCETEVVIVDQPLVYPYEYELMLSVDKRLFARIYRVKMKKTCINLAKKYLPNSVKQVIKKAFFN